MLPTRVLGLPQSTEIDQKPDKKFRQSFIGALAATSEIKKKQVSLVCLLHKAGCQFVPYTE